MSDAILIINGGSSSIKFSLYLLPDTGELEDFANGEIENLDSTPYLHVRDQAGVMLTEQRWSSPATHEELLGVLIKWVDEHLGANRLVAAGHRVAHGGADFKEPVRVTPQVLSRLRGLIPLAPLHQPHNLEPITALTALHPDLPQVACFDTAFHATNNRISRLYGLPRAVSDEGVMHYGFHGLSYEYIAAELGRREPRAKQGRVIVAHLGSGASMCALVAGKSVASTMGFSALDGLLMGTRCGSLDPGVILYLLQEKKMSAQAIESMLYHDSGLLGVSGISNDMRTLLNSDEQHAAEAVDLFVYRIVRELGSLVAAAGGIDVLVFTAGIGEHVAAIRERVCAQSAWLGIKLDAVANENGDACMSAVDSDVALWTLATNEDLMIAQHTAALLFPMSVAV